MRVYNYLLFRIYKFYTDTLKENTGLLVTVTTVSTVLVYFNLITVYTLLVYWDFIKDVVPGKYYVLIPMAVIWLLNYFIFVKKEHFLEYNFKKDKKGGVIIVFYILLTAVLAIVVANNNRGKVFRQQQSVFSTGSVIDQN